MGDQQKRTCTFCQKPTINGAIEYGVHQSCLDAKRREEKAFAMFQAAKLRGAAAMLEAREYPMRDQVVDAAVAGATPFAHAGYTDPNTLPRIPEDVR